jgi:hypothetical protein
MNSIDDMHTHFISMIEEIMAAHMRGDEHIILFDVDDDNEAEGISAIIEREFTKSYHLRGQFIQEQVVVLWEHGFGNVYMFTIYPLPVNIVP